MSGSTRGLERPAGGTIRRRFGYSKNERGDVPQVVVGLAVTREGLPVRCWIFPGHSVEVTTVEQVKADLRGWQPKEMAFSLPTFPEPLRGHRHPV